MDPHAREVACVIIAEIIMSESRPHEECSGKSSERDRKDRLKHIAGAEVEAAREVTGGEQETAQGQIEVPIAGREAPAVWGPEIACGHPNISRPAGGPIAVAIVIPVVAVEPGAGNVKAIRVGRRPDRPPIRVTRWRFDKLEVALRLAGPVPPDPTKSFRGSGPEAWNPMSSRGNIAPKAAYPHEVLLGLVVLPVARNPLDVLALRPLVRRFLG